MNLTSAKYRWLVLIILSFSLIGLLPAAAQSDTATPTQIPSAESTNAVESTEQAESTAQPESTANPTIEPPPEVTESALPPANHILLTFESMHINDTIFVNGVNQQSVRIFFGLPADWQPELGTTLTLDVESVLIAPTNDVWQQDTSNGVLEISVNGIPMSPEVFTWGSSEQITLEIPPSAFVPRLEDQRQEISFSLNTDIPCDTSSIAGMYIKPSSVLDLAYSARPLPVDLRFLPYPFYQQSFQSDNAVFVVPDNPSAAVLQSAMAMAASFGDATFERLGLTLLRQSDLTTEIRDNNHLIYVGQLADFPPLSRISFPVSAAQANAVGSETGIVQMAVSPWNISKLVLFVGGASDDAIIKAGQALSARSLRTAEPHNLALVNQVNIGQDFQNFSQLNGELFTETIVFNRVGRSTEEVSFQLLNVPSVASSPYLDVALSHSTLIDYVGSGVVILLNDIPVGSVQLSEETIEQFTRRVALPPNRFRTGVNTLTFEVELDVLDRCSFVNSTAAWLTINPETTIFIPPASGEATTPLVDPLDLGVFPNPFARTPILTDTAFILPRNDVGAWNAALRVASNIGRNSDGRAVGLEVNFADDVSDSTRQKHLIVFGIPSDLPILSDFEDLIPAPFDLETNQASEEVLPVAFELPSDRDVGYLQLFFSPYSAGKEVLIVAGSGETGVTWAANALVQSGLRQSLFGDFAVIDDMQIIAQRIVPLPSQSGAETLTLPDTDETPVPDITALLGSTPADDRPDWAIPAMRIILITMGVVVILAVITWFARLIMRRGK